ncbi:MAG: hypothetical protein ACYC4K_10420 [Thiobacillus sp.]
MGTYTTAFECPDCGELHDYEDGAAECCAPVPREVFICDECDSINFSEKEAIACCDEDLEQKSPTAEELESAGQFRLID